MMLFALTVTALLVCTVSAQDIGNITNQAPNSIFLPPGYEEVTTPKPDDLGAFDKCGEGSTKGINVCVPYYMCDSTTRTVVQNGKTDGFGIIDIRFGANSCDHPLDVCCGVPKEHPDTSEIPLPPTELPPPPTELPPITPTQLPAITPTESPPVTSTSGKDPELFSCGIRNTNGIDFKITGNNHNEAEYGEFPWMVAILRKNYIPQKDQSLAICGGSLITTKFVLTGAHCVYTFKTDELKIRAGEWDTQTEKERLPYQERDISEIVVHQNFNAQTLFNDVAILHLVNPVEEELHIARICLPPADLVINSRNCFATGWGKTKFGKEGEYQVILKKIELPIVGHEDCQEAFRSTRLGKHFILDSSFICAGGEKGKDTCTGDGGSPLVCPNPNNPSTYVQAGIVAWGIGCGEENIPGVYADVSKFRKWIDNVIN